MTFPRKILTTAALALGMSIGIAALPDSAQAHTVKKVVVVKTKPAYPVARAVGTVVRVATAPHTHYYPVRRTSVRVVRVRY